MQPKCPQRYLRCLHRNNTQHVGPPKTHNLSATGSEAAQAVLVIGALSFSAWAFNVANRMANRNLSYPPTSPSSPTMRVLVSSTPYASIIPSISQNVYQSCGKFLSNFIHVLRILYTFRWRFQDVKHDMWLMITNYG